MDKQYLKTIRYFLLTILSLFISTYSNIRAQNTNNSLLYKISGNALKADSYLYGTIHIMPKKDFKISNKTKRAFNMSSILAMEIDLNMDLKTKIAVAQQTILPNRQTLQDIMKASEYSRLKQFVLDSIKVKKSKFKKYQRLKPFFFSSAIMQEQLKNTKSYEVEFNKMAKKKKMLIIGLESIYSQLNLINKIDIKEQLEILTSELYAKADQNSFSQMIELYKNEELNELYKITSTELGTMEGFTEDFLELRNKNWIPKIEELIRKNSVFIAVGAGHLAGESGVINLLKARGYCITPITN